MPDNIALDMLVKNANEPALSATSDLPQPVEVTENLPLENSPNTEQDNSQAVSQEEIPENSANSDKDSGLDTAANAQEGAKPSKGVQKRIDEITRQKGDAERRAEALEQRLKQTLDIIERQTPKQEEVQPQESYNDVMPTREVYDDPDAYNRDLARWSARNEIRQIEENRRQLEAQAKQQEVFQKKSQEWEAKKLKAIEKYPDYSAVAENPNLNIAQHVGFAILESEHSAEVAYHLGKNPEEAARLSALSPIQAAMEIGALGARLSSTRPEVSRAPAPVKPVGARNDASGKSPDAESMEEYAARRNAELKSKRR